MKTTYKQVFLLLLVMLITSCRLFKHTTSNSSTHSESSAIVENKVSELEWINSSTYSRKDTTVMIASRSVIDTITIESLSPLTNDKGEKVSNTSIVRGKGVSVTTTALPNGNIVITGTCDSMEMIITGLIEEKSLIQGMYQNLYNSLKSSDKTEAIQETDKTTKASPHWVLVLIIIVFIGVLGLRLYYNFWKK